MQKKYDPKKIERYAQLYWKINKTFQVIEDNTKEKYYCLPMIPYPSGKLHMGHVRNYTISDVISRYQRMLGKNVLQPIGWDAFGLPAEEAAIKNDTFPSVWTYENIKYMKKQLQSLGFSYDWSREITTCNPEYYQWEQWFFIKLFEKQMVYKKNSLVNWCPYDQTVLANEQVIDNNCWRCQTPVILKNIPQWFIKIRNYAESLYQDLKKLTHWPEKVKNMQKNWIGRSKGFEITLKIVNQKHVLKAFIKRLDVIIHAKCILISPCHKLSIHISNNNKDVKKFITINNNLSKEEAENNKYVGVNSGLTSIHPISGKLIPIWISNFIVKEYGTKAVMSIPEYNKNDYLFFVKNRFKIKNLNPSFNKKINNFNINKNAQLIYTMLLQKNIISKKIIYKLQNWCISRQRYWGAPIPMAAFKNGKITPIPENQLPILVPKITKNVQYSFKKIQVDPRFLNITIDKKTAIKETDTFDTFMESSWYYARYTCPHFTLAMIDPHASKYWLPVDQYVGGIEHAIMHLMYFRFYHKLLRDFKLVDHDEPVKNLLCQGMVLSPAFYTIENNKEKNWINAKDVLIEKNQKGKTIQISDKFGKKVIYAGMIKMSKSKNNGVEPEIMIHRYGADTIRLFIMFAAPVESELEWSESGVKGIYRFLNRIWSLSFQYISIKKQYKKVNTDKLNIEQSNLRYLLHKTIAKVTDDIQRRKSYNTAISAIIEFVNKLKGFSIKTDEDCFIMKESLTCIIKMLYPFTPHFSFIIWNFLKKKPIDYETWPVFEKNILLETSINLVIQINGKMQCSIKVSRNDAKETIILNAKNQVKMKKKLKNTKIKKIIYVPNKIINFVI